MSRKLVKCSTNIWAFLAGLTEHFVDPTRYEIMQLNNGLQTRRKKSRFAVTVNRVISTAETKLRNQTITPIEFLTQVSYHQTIIMFLKLMLNLHLNMLVI